MRIIKPSFELILEVLDIQFSILESFPPQIHVQATGTVPSKGWTRPQLIPYTYIQLPPDGIYDYAFVAIPPRQVAAQVLSRISTRLQEVPQGAKGIRVHASLNSKEILIPQDEPACPEAGMVMAGGRRATV